MKTHGLKESNERIIMKKLTTDSIIIRYFLFIIGLFIASFGVAISTKAGLGTSPVSAIPYSVSLINTSLSFGAWLNLLSILQITIQVLILRKKCKPFEILVQIVLAFCYGYMTNFSCYLIRDVRVEGYVWQFLFMILSCFVLAFGIWIQLKGNVAMLPGEAMNRAISQTTGRKYENIKILFDVLYIIISAAICFIWLGELKGVREGSVIAAFLVGTIIKLYNSWFEKLKAAHTKSDL